MSLFRIRNVVRYGAGLGVIILLVSLWLLTGNSVRVHAATVLDNGDFVFQVLEDGKSAEIIQYNGKSLYVSVPSMVDKYKVTQIGTAAFMSNKTIKELEISTSVENIESSAFSGCQALKKVSISGSVETIGECAFMNCPALETVQLEEGVMTIKDSAFSGCTSLKSIELPNSVIVLGKYAFFNCTVLEDISIPNTIDELGGYALEGTKWLKNQTTDCVTIADGILIKYTGGETAKSLPAKVKKVGDYAFAGNEKIETILLSRNVTKVGKSAFEGCSNLTTVSLPDTITDIGECAFKGCGSLNDVTLPSNLKELKEDVFYMCACLSSITIPAKVETVRNGAFMFCESLKNVRIQNGVKKIEEFAFFECISLGRIVFPESLKEIATASFASCINLTRAEFNGDTEISFNSFGDCPHLKEAVFYKNPTNISDYAFVGCAEMTLYSSESLYIEDFARRMKMTSENLKNLPPYEDKGLLAEGKPDTEEGFSGTYTFIVVMIVLVDLALIVLFSVYILLDQKKKCRRRKAGAARRAVSVGAEGTRPVPKQSAGTESRPRRPRADHMPDARPKKKP